MPFRDRQVIHILKESFEQSVHAVKASIYMSMECIEERQNYGKIWLRSLDWLVFMLLLYRAMIYTDPRVRLGMLAESLMA